MPLPLVVIAVVGFAAVAASSLSAAVVYHTKKAGKKLSAKPVGTPRPPSGTARSDLLKSAQDKLGMDARNRFNFAFCGGCGSGKSSLINAIRNREDVHFTRDKAHHMLDSAPIGNWQTTMKTLCYAFPENHQLQHVRLWDMPGCGTDEHPSASYFEDKALYAFDVLLLVVESELGEYQYLILEKAQQQNIPIVIVVTKADQKVESTIRVDFSTRNPPLDEYKDTLQKTLDEGRQRIAASLRKRKLAATSVFVVSSWKYREFSANQENDIQLGRQEIDGQSMLSCLTAEDEEREKIAALSLELSQLLEHIANIAVRRRL